MDEKIKNLMKSLRDIGAIKLGKFMLKSGVESPVYVDLRLVVSYPKLLKDISEALFEKMKVLQYDFVCGVPYTALPMATAVSLNHDIPMVMRRKEVKAYGTGKIIEGVFEPNKKCVVIEDVVTSGLSLFETIAPLEEAGLKVQDIIVLVDREQGGRQKIEEKGYRLHSLFTLTELLS